MVIFFWKNYCGAPGGPRSAISATMDHDPLYFGVHMFSDPTLPPLCLLASFDDIHLLALFLYFWVTYLSIRGIHTWADQLPLSALIQIQVKGKYAANQDWSKGNEAHALVAPVVPCKVTCSETAPLVSQFLAVSTKSSTVREMASSNIRVGLTFSSLQRNFSSTTTAFWLLSTTGSIATKRQCHCHCYNIRQGLSLIHIWRCRRIERCRSRWSPYH